MECSWLHPILLSRLWNMSLCSCLCLVYAIVKLHAMDENMFIDFLIGSESGFYMQ